MATRVSRAGSVGRGLVDEQLRRGSARATKTIVRWYGDRLGIWLGCGYPKSGTVWLGQLLSSYLSLPYPRHYRTPVAMPSVLHAHWLPDDRLPRSVYVVRDGRDVMVSLYFYEVRLATRERNPYAARRRRERFRRVLGPSADLNDARANLPRFIEAEMESPAWMNATWPAHVGAWLDARSDRVAVVRYEDLLAGAEDALAPAIERLTGAPADRRALTIAAERFAFDRRSGRSQGEEQRTSFLRKGIAGDWRNHFTDEAALIFDQAAGATLDHLGYRT